LGPIQSSVIQGSTGLHQVTNQRTRLLGVRFVTNMRGAAHVYTIDIRNGSIGSLYPDILFRMKTNVSSNDSMIFPSGSYIPLEDGLHATITTSSVSFVVAITLIYQK
jgi:hypothetical protein